MSYMSSWIYSSLVENGWKLKKLLQVEYCMVEVWFVHICMSRSQWFFNFGWDSWKSFISYMCSWIYSSLVENGWKLKELQMFENGPKYKGKVKKLGKWPSQQILSTVRIGCFAWCFRMMSIENFFKTFDYTNKVQFLYKCWSLTNTFQLSYGRKTFPIGKLVLPWNAQVLNGPIEALYSS